MIAKNKKRTQIVIILVIAAVIVLVGAFAWNSFAQQRINIFKDEVKPGVTLHDDFDEGPDKDVYVENFGQVRVFVRVRLTEYLETAGRGSLIAGHVRDDETAKLGWFPHNGIANENDCEIQDPFLRGESWFDEDFHTYYEWTMGGQKYYMPALFQAGAEDAYSDNPPVLSDLTEYDGTEENVQQTLFASVITMAQWLDGGYKYWDGTTSVTVVSGEKAQGNFWVVDTDGWCYWAQPLEPDTATGLLLDKVERTKKQFDSTAEYCINVWLQAVDEIDIGLFEVEQYGGITANGRLLTQLVSENILSGSDGYYQNNRDGTFTQVTDEDGEPLAEPRAFIPLGQAAANANITGKINTPEENRLYIGDKFNVALLKWKVDDYTNYDVEAAKPAPHYNLTRSETGKYTVVGSEIGADGNVYLRMEDSEGNIFYLSSTLRVEQAQQQAAIMPFSEEENEPEDPPAIPESEPEPEPEPDVPPQFDKYVQGYPGTGPYAVMYQGGSKIGTRKDTRYDPENAGFEAQYFEHIGNGVYVRLDENGEQLDPITYYFSSRIFGDNPFEVNNSNGNSVEAQVEAIFSLTLTVGEEYGVWDDPDTGYTMILKGEAMEAALLLGQGHPDGIETRFTMKELHENDDGKLYIHAYFEGKYEDYYLGTGEDGTFGGLYFGILMQMDEEGQMGPIKEIQAGGDGSQEKPFKIRSRNEMNWLTREVMNGNTFEGKYLEVVKDFSMDTTDFLPVGNLTTQFKGTFDGGGYTISKLKITGASVAGLFAYIGAAGTVKNVTLEDVNININGSAGGISAANYGTVQDCHVLGGSIKGTMGVGSIAVTNSGSITGCSNSASVEGTSYTGGVVGINGGAMGVTGGTVENCDNTGTVKTTTGDYTGGIAGVSNGILEDCSNEGEVTGVARYTGGVVGNNARVTVSGTVRGCDNKGTVIGGSRYTGGIAGHSEGNIENCVNEGNVPNEGKSCVGGIVGRTGSEYSKITGSRNTGAITGDRQVGGVVGVNDYGTVSASSNTGKITGTDQVGGVVGHNWTGTKLEQCYNTGEAVGTSTAETYIGGIVGISYGTVLQCGNEGKVTGAGSKVGGVAGENVLAIKQCYSNGEVTGAGSVGGVVGHNNTAGTVMNCYAWGNVKGSSSFVGGVIGNNNNNSVGINIVHLYHAKGTVSGTIGVGGIIGMTPGGSSSASRLTITRCIALSDSVAGTASYIHKLVGMSGNPTYTTITSCYSRSDMTCVSPGSLGMPGTSIALATTKTNPSWWKTTVGGDFANDNIWNYSKVNATDQDYPTLTDVSPVTP